MSLLARFQRRSLENPSTPLSDPAAWLYDALGARKSATGLSVTPEGSLAVTAVLACVEVIGGTLATLPLPVYKRLPDGGKEKATSHPLYVKLHDRPNPEMTSVTFRETMQTHLLLWGNAFAEIERNQANLPLALWPIHPSRVKIEFDGVRKLFWVRNRDGVHEPFSRDDILHIPGLSLDGVIGMSPIQHAREAIGLAAATESFGARFFGTGSRVSGLLKHPNLLSPDAAKRFRESFERIHQGLEGAHRVAVLEEGADFVQTSVPPNDAQFLETRRFQTEEIARIFRVPLHLIGDLTRATFSNIEHQAIEFVVHTMRPWLVRWEQVLNWELFGDRSEFFCEFVIDGLLRGDSAGRAAFYKEMFAVGAFSPNRILEIENENAVPGGDERFIPMNMVPLSKAGELVDAQIEKAKAPPPSPAPPAREEPEPEEEEVANAA